MFREEEHGHDKKNMYRRDDVRLDAERGFGMG